MPQGKHGRTRLVESTAGRPSLDAAPCDLGTAIVHRACVDYLMALRGRKSHNRERMDTPADLERFFRSPWFQYLCNADGDLIIEALQRMHQRGEKTVYFTPHPDERKGIPHNGEKHSLDFD